MTQCRRVYVDEQAISIRNMSDLMARIETALIAGKGFTVFTLNLDHLVKRRQVAEFRRVYNDATFVTADGWPVVRLARRMDPSFERTTGADIIMPLCRLVARHKVPIALFGSTAPVLSAAAAKLRGLCPDLDVVFLESPPFDFDPSGDAGADAIARIEASGAGVCLVALGAPKQEILSGRGVAMGGRAGFVCIGAGLDFIAGTRLRAPSLVQNLRLEWAWRLAIEPGRLGLRYTRCALLYARLLSWEAWLRRPARQR